MYQRTDAKVETCVEMTFLKPVSEDEVHVISKRILNYVRRVIRLISNGRRVTS
jgi:hypothetical protein